MSAKEQISRLESLLARVQKRAAEPRPMAQAAQAAPKTNGGTPAMAAAAPPPPAQTPATPRVSEPPEAAFPSARPAAAGPVSTPPIASRPSTFPPMTIEGGDSSDVDVEVSSEVVDIDVDMDIDEMGMPLESGAQPVGDHAALADDGGIGETTMADAQLPVLGPENEVHSEEQPAPVQALANEIQEPAPSSSPRPITSEKPETFEEESAPRHTPPPESGKQVAAAPSAPPRKLTSSPPPSLDGHTLIGGWREPGLGGPVIGAPTAPQGVRVPPPAGQSPSGPSREMPAEPITATRSSLPPRHSDRPLSPEVTRADLSGTAKVAAFEGSAPSFKPSTFGDLLDASLDL